MLVSSTYQRPAAAVWVSTTCLGVVQPRGSRSRVLRRLRYIGSFIAYTLSSNPFGLGKKIGHTTRLPIIYNTKQGEIALLCELKKSD